MAFPNRNTIDQWKREWTDVFVRVKADARPNLKRFETKIGRVVTVNYSGRAIVDFGDQAWYDVADFQDVLERVTDEAEIAKFDRSANSAQPLPAKQ